MSNKSNKKIKDTKVLKDAQKTIFFTSIILIIIIVIAGLTYSFYNAGGENNEPKKDLGSVPTEKTIEEEFNLTKTEAIDLVRGTYNSDNYEFSAIVTANGMYEITATNILDSSKTVFILDPATLDYQLKK